MTRETVVHPTAIIGPEVTLDSGVWVGPFAVILGKTFVGEGTRIRAHAVIGTPAEKHGHMTEPGKGVFIGKRCHISEFVTIHAGTEIPTYIGDDVLLLRGSHVGHDSTIHAGAVISCNVMIGGHSWIGKGANLALGCVLHQFSKVGAWAMLGMGAVLPKKRKIVPGNIYVGNPARFLRNNTIGIQRSGVEQKDLQESITQYHAVTQDWRDE